MIVSAAYVTGTPIIVKNNERKNNVLNVARMLNVEGCVEVYTMDEWYKYKAMHLLNTEVMVDDVESILGQALSQYIGANVIATTMSIPMEEKEFIKNENQSDGN